MVKSQPPALVSGDIVRIVSTARAIAPEELESATRLLTSWGYKVQFGANTFARENQFAGNDTLRAADFNAALSDADVKAIFCARGGYGSVRIVDLIDWKLLEHQPKWIFGYSDITVLHNHIFSHLQVMSCHSSMPINFSTNTSESLQSIKGVLEGKFPEYEFPAHPLNRPGEASGLLVGGNLSVLYSLLGSSSDIDTDGNILLLEDLDEYLYHIDRMMQNLKRSGKLKNLAGLVVGGFTDMRDNSTPFGLEAEKIIADAVKDYSFPVAFNFPAGHISNNCSVVMGCPSVLHTAERSTLKQKPDVI